MSLLDTTRPSTPGKLKQEKSLLYLQTHHQRSLRLYSSLSKFALSSFFFLIIFLFFSLLSSPSSPSNRSKITNSLPGGSQWEKKVLKSARPKLRAGFTVFVTGAAGFVGTHVSVALKRRGDGVLGLDNFNHYYDVNLKRDRQKVLERSGVFVVEAQAGVRYAMQNPKSYVNSNIAEKDRTDQPASLYAATKKAGEALVHSYNHIYGLSITGLRFFTVYGPWGRPDMAYFFFTKNILKGKEIGVYETADGKSVARDFTYIDDIVKGCLAALDTAKNSTGSGGKKRGPAQLRVFNLGNTSPVPVSKLVSILDISSAQRELGYMPATDLETGLKKFVRWYTGYFSGSKKKKSW
ncbi:UDP-glucuronate 4-epimerase 5 isoform X1 [Populus alba x Populus x berolinensis]|nr:UDP-glucuronate 4-epimerase 5 isoform X1 [Populus alba x Populus x berolinensis]